MGKKDATAGTRRGPGGGPARTLRQLEVVLLPAIGMARDAFRAATRGQPGPAPDPALASIFADYRHYLRVQEATLHADGDDPSELFGDYDTAIALVLDCLARLGRGEAITRPEAAKAVAWLRDVPGETLLFN